MSLLLFFSCTKDEGCEVTYQTQFNIEDGKEYCFPDGSILSILEITNSYCPCDVQCIWQGEAVVKANWSDPDGSVEEILIHEIQRDQNPRWIEFSSVKSSSDCAPVVEEFKIRVVEKSSLPDECGPGVTVDKNLYDKGPKDHATIIDASIIGDCLTISYSASGCDGNSWIVKTFDSGDVAESEPEQRYIRLSLDNPEACLAVFTKDISFDLVPLQIPNNGVLLLNIQDYDTQLRYEY